MCIPREIREKKMKYFFEKCLQKNIYVLILK